jgi:cysteine desulfurase / selenocysteine lyase
MVMSRGELKMSNASNEVVKHLDVEVVKKDFPILSRRVHDQPLVYLDSAATALQPRAVLDAVDHYYETTHANVHRGVYATAEEATNLYERARIAAGRFIGAPKPATEIVFTKNTTESLNLIAHSYGRSKLSSGDVVLLSEMEHHANIVPWLMLKEEKGIEIRYIPVDDQGLLILDDLDKLLKGVKLVGIAAMSNVLGTINPVADIAIAAHGIGAVVVVDGAQSVPHFPVDVLALGADFLAFSGHKMMAPTGIGVMWARTEILESMPPFLGGGGMILDVQLDRFIPANGPSRFEAGTPPIGEAIGLHAAIRYLNELGMGNIRAHEQELTNYALKAFEDRLGSTCRIYGPPFGDSRGGVFSIGYRDIHAHDLAQVLDQTGVCVRPGHHCAKPLMKKLGVTATARASIGPYNDTHDIDVLIDGIAEAGRLFG